jgi:hypothetical protein
MPNSLVLPNLFFKRSQQPVGMVTITFELEHTINHVLQHFRACDEAILGDVADEDHRECPVALANRMSSAVHSRT